MTRKFFVVVAVLGLLTQVRLPILTLVLVIGSVVPPVAQSRSTVPFDREGLAKIIDNDRVIVWKGLLGIKSRPTPLHEHVLDLVGVFLDDGGIGKVTMLDGAVRQGAKPTRRGGVVFQGKGVVHVEEQLLDGIRAVGIELKATATIPFLGPQQNVQRSFPRDGATLLLENDRVAIFDYQWKTGQIVLPTIRDRDSVVVTLESGEVRFTNPDGKTRLTRYAFGDVEFVPRGETAQEEATGGTPRVIVVELK